MNQRLYTLGCRVLHAHLPSSLGALRGEHTVMAGAYGLAAFLTHSPVGSAVVGLGYLSVAWGSARHQRRLREDARHAVLPLDRLSADELEDLRVAFDRLGLSVQQRAATPTAAG